MPKSIEYERPIPADQEFSKRGLARETRSSPKSIDEWIDDGLPVHRRGQRKYTIRWGDYLDWLRSKRVLPRDRSHVEQRAAELLQKEARHGR